MSSSAQDPTALLLAWRDGDAAALDQLVPLLADELRRLAANYMAREPAGHTLQPTALVNEAYLRLINVRRIDWQNRAHFMAMAARTMRRILVDSARARGNEKRGGGIPKLSLDEVAIDSLTAQADVLQLDESLRALAVVYPRQHKVVELRFFGGLTIEETAEVLGVSPDTVKRDWRFAKLWLVRELSRAPVSPRAAPL